MRTSTPAANEGSDNCMLRAQVTAIINAKGSG